MAKNTAAKKIVVIGGGFAGALIAKKLAKKLKKTNTEITIIDKNPFMTVLTELHEVAACRVGEESIRIDLEKIFAGRKVNVVLDNITSADHDSNIIHGTKASYPYDYLVMATGCKPAFFGVEGAKAHAFTLWSYEDATRLRDHILSMFRQAETELDPKVRKALLNFYVVGAGFTGVEMAGELAEMIPHACEEFKINPEEVQLHMVDVLDKVMPFLPEKPRMRAVKRLDKMGVKTSLSTNVTGIGADSITLVKNGKTVTDQTHTVMWVAGVEGSDFALQSEALGLAPRSRGRVQTDEFLRSLEHPNVYVAGDNMFFIPKGQERPVPQMVENCEACAPIITDNIVSEIKGKKPEKEYNPTFHGEMVCIGGRYGVASISTGKRRFTLPSFFAMFAKHFMNMVVFFQLAGWAKVFSYMRHEFFTIRNRRSFVGGHFSNRGPLFLTVPLRIFMGLHFIYLAYRRYAMGWADSLQLRNMYYDIAGQFRPALEEVVIADRVRFSIFTLNDTMHVWLQTTPVSWFLDRFVFASCQTEMFFQITIMVLELLIGLALIAGLFTTLASLGTIVFAGITMLTVGINFYNAWIPFAAVANMFIGGRVLSLDYYVIPWLKKRWKKCRLVKKWYIYHD